MINGIAQARAYPPYGYMILEWEKLTRKPRKAPPAWHAKMAYDEWRDKVVELLSRVIWPCWKNGAWQGAAAEFMDQVTNDDFDLLTGFRAKIHEELTLGDEKLTQYQLFILEDEADAVDVDGVVKLDRSVDASLRKYLAGKASKKLVDHLASGYIAGIHAKAGMVDLDLKLDMQRPRPYQVALIKGIRFSHQHAKSAVTPSMISGHCLELLMGGVAAFLRARELGCSSAALSGIAEHMVDCGDRRVYAGVHYPSDNISSWITGLLLNPLVSHDEAGQKWLWKAIRESSAVYREIEHSLDAGRCESFSPAMSLIQEIGAGKIRTIDEALAHVSTSAPVLAVPLSAV